MGFGVIHPPPSLSHHMTGGPLVSRKRIYYSSVQKLECEISAPEYVLTGYFGPREHLRRTYYRQDTVQCGCHAYDYIH